MTTVHQQRMLDLADRIERGENPTLNKQKLGFNMADYISEEYDGYTDMTGHMCDTTACIAGWAAAQTGDFCNVRDVGTIAREYLGLDENQANALFFGHPINTLMLDVTPAQAAAVLRRLARTGVVQW